MRLSKIFGTSILCIIVAMNVSCLVAAAESIPNNPADGGANSAPATSASSSDNTTYKGNLGNGSTSQGQTINQALGNQGGTSNQGTSSESAADSAALSQYESTTSQTNELLPSINADAKNAGSIKLANAINKAGNWLVSFMIGAFPGYISIQFVSDLVVIVFSGLRPWFAGCRFQLFSDEVVAITKTPYVGKHGSEGAKSVPTIPEGSSPVGYWIKRRIGISVLCGVLLILLIRGYLTAITSTTAYILMVILNFIFGNIGKWIIDVIKFIFSVFN